MLICQPPIQQVEVRATCCRLHRSSIDRIDPPIITSAYLPDNANSPSERLVQNINGITIGDLHDRARELIEQHRYCPHANNHDLDDFGFVNAGVHFVGHLHVRQRDPILRETQQRQNEFYNSESNNRAIARRKHQYCRAKAQGASLDFLHILCCFHTLTLISAAMRDGRPMPTLREHMEWILQNPSAEQDPAVTRWAATLDDRFDPTFSGPPGFSHV